MAAGKAESSWQFKMNLEFRRALSEQERSWRILPNSTDATLSGICSSRELQERGTCNYRDSPSGGERRSGSGGRAAWFSCEVHRPERRATGALADVPDQVPHLHSLFGHEQDDGAVAIEGPRLQRPGGGSAGRLGLGAGDDGVHPPRRLID